MLYYQLMAKTKRIEDGKDLPLDNGYDQLQYKRLLDNCRKSLKDLRGYRHIVAKQAGVSKIRIMNFMNGQDKQPPISDMKRILAACKEVSDLIN
jgi:hypothetical protein